MLMIQEPREAQVLRDAVALLLSLEAMPVPRQGLLDLEL